MHHAEHSDAHHECRSQVQAGLQNQAVFDILERHEQHLHEQDVKLQHLNLVKREFELFRIIVDDHGKDCISKAAHVKMQLKSSDS